MPKLSTKDKPPDRGTTMRVSARQNPNTGGKVQSVPGRSAVKAPKSAPSLKGGAKTPKSAPSLKSGMQTPTTPTDAKSVISTAPSAISGNMEKSRQFSTAGSKSGMSSMRSQSMLSRIGSMSRRGTSRGDSSKAGPGGVVIVQQPPPEDDRRRIFGIPLGIFVCVVIAAIVLLLIIIVVVVVVVVVKGKEEDKIVVNMKQQDQHGKDDGHGPDHPGHDWGDGHGHTHGPDDGHDHTTTTTKKVLTGSQEYCSSKPTDLLFILDYSMSSAIFWGNYTDRLKRMVDGLPIDEDLVRVGMIGFGSGSFVLQDLNHKTDLAGTKSTIKGLEDFKSQIKFDAYDRHSSVFAGLMEAYVMMKRVDREAATSVVIVLSDGGFTYGAYEHECGKPKKKPQCKGIPWKQENPPTRIEAIVKLMVNEGVEMYAATASPVWNGLELIVSQNTSRLFGGEDHAVAVKNVILASSEAEKCTTPAPTSTRHCRHGVME